MRNSEKLLSAFCQMYFYKELVQDNLLFTPQNGSELELADLLINLDYVIVAIQLKERNEAHMTTDLEKESDWLEHQAKKAKSQIKDTINYIANENLPEFQTSSGMSVAVKKTADVIPLFLFMNKTIKKYRRIRSINSSKINCMSFEDFQTMCNVLVTPIEIADYLEWRVVFFTENPRTNVVFFQDEYDDIIKAKSEEGFARLFLAQKYNIKNIGSYEDDLKRFRYFLTQVPIRVVDETEENTSYYIVKLLALLDRTGIRLFMERLQKAFEISICNNEYIVGELRSEKAGAEWIIFFVAGSAVQMDFLKQLAFKKMPVIQNILQIFVYQLDDECFRIDFCHWLNETQNNESEV